MMDSIKFVEKLLQYYRFKKIKPFLDGDILDFGGNRGELKKFVRGDYSAVNNDNFLMDNVNYDTIVCLAVIEHINPPKVHEVFCKFKNILNQNGKILITTPTREAKPILEFMAFVGFLDKNNLAEHKHYWCKKEIFVLAEKAGLFVKTYNKFQFGCNQLVILEHEKNYYIK
jgi:2-polyprenyl-3-methyl-5-hydroxy-6-metoxy-1,4-benzoquinol methylase